METDSTVVDTASVDSISAVIDSLMSSSASEGFLYSFGWMSAAMVALLGVVMAIHLINRAAGR